MVGLDHISYIAKRIISFTKYSIIGRRRVWWHISAITCQIIMSTCQENIFTTSSLILFSYPVDAPNCHLLVSLISDKSTK